MASLSTANWSAVRPRLLPVVRQADFSMGTPYEPPPIPFRPFAPCLSEFVVVDLPDRVEYVTIKRLADWNVTVDDVFAAARENLAGHFANLLDKRSTEGPQAMAFVGAGHSYFSSLPLLDGWLAAWSAGWGGVRPLFAITVQGELLVVPEPDDPGQLLPLLAGIEQEWTEAARPVSPVLYTLDADGEPVPFDVPPGVPADHPARHAIRRSRGLLANTVYDAQTKHLRENAELGDPFFAALQRFSRRGSDISFTVATWGEDEWGLLPEADWVAFANDDGQFFVRWDDVARECGLVPEAGYHPARYHVEAWPAPEVMTRLRALADQP
ncbi:hypothetical protein [Catenulispora subtropica]|uniref:Uncharacterized protein n=1 Tax=Catenulispora subtropica TaxID=450798 RepID=A0ABN2RXF7_9ACTN